MRAKELRARSDEELSSLLAEARDQLFQSRMKNATHQLDDTGRIQKTRREIARILTVMTERSKGIGPASGAAADEEEE